MSTLRPTIDTSAAFSKLRWAAFAILIFLVLGAGAGCGDGGKTNAPPSKAEALRMGMMPKLMGIDYFNQCMKGAKEAANELGVDLTFDGPHEDSVDAQAQMVSLWAAQGFDAIAVAPNDPEVISPALRKAREAGSVVLTWDADANAAASGREIFVNQSPTAEIGNTLVDVMAEGIGRKGKTVIVTGSATSPNQNAWMKVMRQRLAERYPDITVLPTLVPDEDQNRARQLTLDVLRAHPDLVGIWGITSVALPGAAEGVKQAGKSGKVFVTGLSLPSSVKAYVKDGTIAKFVLWNPVDLGYLTVHVAHQLKRASISHGVHSFGRLQQVRVENGEVILGPPIIFDKANIDRYDF